MSDPKAEPDAIEQQARDWLATYSYPDHENPSMVMGLVGFCRKLVREAEARERAMLEIIWSHHERGCPVGCPFRSRGTE